MHGGDAFAPAARRQARFVDPPACQLAAVVERRLRVDRHHDRLGRALAREAAQRDILGVQRVAARPEVRDSVGNVLADGDAVTLIKDLKVKGAGQTLKRGTVIKSIRLTGDAQEIDCRYEAIKGLVLRAEFVRKL